MKHIFLIALLCGCCMACSNSLSPQEYISWVQDTENGLHKQLTHDAYQLDVQYKPSAYMILTTSNAVKEDKSVLDSMQYYTLVIRFPSSFCQQMERNEKLRDYLSFGIEEDIELHQKGKVYKPVIFHYERALAMQCTASYVLAFENPEQDIASERNLRLSLSLFSTPAQLSFTHLVTPAVDIP